MPSDRQTAEVERMRAAATTGYRRGCYGHAETDAPVVLNDRGEPACPMCAAWNRGEKVTA